MEAGNLNAEHSMEFEPVIFLCQRYPSLSFQPSFKNEDDVTVGEHWSFSHGIFICHDEKTLAIVRKYLKDASPYVRQLIREATSADEANNLQLKNMMDRRKENLAISGPFTSDVMGARNSEITEVQLQQDMARMGIQPKEGDAPNEFQQLGEALKGAAKSALGEGGDKQI